MKHPSPRQRARRYAAYKLRDLSEGESRKPFSIRDALEDAWLAGYRSCARRRKAERRPLLRVADLSND